MAKAQQNPRPFSLLYLLFFGILPVIYVNTLTDYTLVPRQLFVGIALVVILFVAWTRKGTGTFAPGGSTLFFLGFLAVSFVAVTQAVNTVESWGVVARYVLSFCYLTTTLLLLRSQMLTSLQLITAVVLFAGISAIITLFNLMMAIASGEFAESIYSVSGTFSHKNLLSSVLMLSFPFTVMGSVMLGRRGWRRTSLVLALVLVAEMFILRTRGVWLSMFVGGATAVPMLLVVRRRSKVEIKLPFKWIGVGAAIALVLAVGVLVSRGTGDLVNRTNLDRRLVFWQNSWEMIQEKPALGVGPGNWKIHFPKHGLSSIEQMERGYLLDPTVYEGVTQIQRPHNDYLWVWSESGPLGLLFFLGIFGAAIWSLLRNLRSPESLADVGIDISVLFGLVAYLTFSLTDFPLERPSHNVLAMSLVALSFRKSHQRRFALPVKVVVPILLAGLAFSILVSWYRWQGEKYSVVVLEANRRQNARMIVPAVEEAMNPFYNMDNVANPLPYYSSLGKLFLGDMDGALRDGQMALEIHPYSIISLNQMGNVLKFQGELDKALEYYHRATDISIRFEAAQLNKAEIYNKQGKPAEAVDALSYVSAATANPKYHKQLATALPSLVARQAQHGRYERLVRYLEDRNPESPREYVAYFLELRADPSQLSKY